MPLHIFRFPLTTLCFSMLHTVSFMLYCQLQYGCLHIIQHKHTRVCDIYSTCTEMAGKKTSLRRQCILSKDGLKASHLLIAGVQLHCPQLIRVLISFFVCLFTQLLSQLLVLLCIFSACPVDLCIMNDIQLTDLTDFLKKCFNPSSIATIISDLPPAGRAGQNTP